MFNLFYVDEPLYSGTRVFTIIRSINQKEMKVVLQFSANRFSYHIFDYIKKTVRSFLYFYKKRFSLYK